jgi:NTP pyrophosphatase (non-canonical NTP hydrolase)
MNQKLTENQIKELMVITAEECGELTQACCKIYRWDIDGVFETSSNKQRLIDEAGDVMAMISIMVENDILTKTELNDRIDYKKRKLEKWSNLFE